MKSFDQKIYREEFRARRQPRKKRGPYNVAGLTRDPKAYKAAYYRRRREQGLCACCGKPNTTNPGRANCEACKIKQRKTKTTTP